MMDFFDDNVKQLYDLSIKLSVIILYIINKNISDLVIVLWFINIIDFNSELLTQFEYIFFFFYI